MNRRAIGVAALLVMLVSVNLTRGGYTVLAQGMTWIECRGLLGQYGPSAWPDRYGNIRQHQCRAEPGDPTA